MSGCPMGPPPDPPKAITEGAGSDRHPQAPELPAVPEEPRELTQRDLTYNDYLHVPELLELQVPRSDPPHHDEMLFIVIHQAYELWFKLVLHELDQAVEQMREGQPLRAHHFVVRVVEVMRLLVQQIHIIETMRPADFLQFRDRLLPASGFQSLQFRALEFYCGLKDERYLRFFKERDVDHAELVARLEGPDLRTELMAMLRRGGFAIPEAALVPGSRDEPETFEETLRALRPLYADPERHMASYLLCEAIVQVDEFTALWREHHVRVVSRVIGGRRGTGGSSGVAYLESTTNKQAFPELWAVRTQLGEPSVRRT